MKLNKLLATIFAVLLLSAVLCSVSAASAKYADNQCIRVGLYYGSSAKGSVYLSSLAGFAVVELDDFTGDYTPIFQTADTAVNIKYSGGKIVVFGSSGAPLYTGGECIIIRGINNAVAFDGKTYLENIKLRANGTGLDVINILTLENYIKGVLPREIYPSWPEESLKSAAVVARSFAISSLSGKHDASGFDVCTTTCCQVFGGNGANENARTNAAIDATKNIVVAYDTKVALTVYTSSVGDRTESASGAWGGSSARYPYLVSVETPFETPEEYPNGLWSYTLTSDEIKNQINPKFSPDKRLTGDILSINCEHGESGFVRKMTITDTHGKVIEVKNSGAVRDLMFKYFLSAKFTVTPHYFEEGSTVAVQTSGGIVEREAVPYGSYVLKSGSEVPQAVYSNYIPLSFTFDGVGYGHGVGLSQFGAMTMAKNGAKYDEILSTYFPNTFLTTLSALEMLNSIGDIGDTGEIFEEFDEEIEEAAE